MQVILKQRDIEQALKQYIAGQGINLKGKTVNIAFTAGRKETGISAELDIDDISGYIPAAEDLTKDGGQDPILPVAEPESEVAAASAEGTVASEATQEAPFDTAVAESADSAAEPVVKASSLFA